MRPYLVETIRLNSGGVRYRVVSFHPSFKLASLAFKNSKTNSGVVESRLYEACIDFDRLIDEHPKSK